MSRREKGFVEKELRLKEGLQKGDHLSSVVRAWARLAERYYPNVAWRRILCLDEDEGDESAWARMSER